jgi:hypothetical protein
MQIDDLLRKLDAKEGEVSRMMEEKDQELAILQEGMDSTLQQMNDLRLVSMRADRFLVPYLVLICSFNMTDPRRERQRFHRTG